MSVDHIIPFSVAPQLDKVIANLKLMPLRMNISKREAMGQRQLDLLQRLRQAGRRLGRWNALRLSSIVPPDPFMLCQHFAP